MSEIFTANVSYTEILCVYMGVCVYLCVHTQSCAHCLEGRG